MNILFLLFSFTTGGAERMVSDLSRHMSKNGHEVHLCIVNRHYDDSMLQGISPDVHLFLMDRPVGSGSIPACMKKLDTYIREHGINVIHCQEVDGVILCARIKMFQPKVRIVCTIHDVHLFSCYPRWKQWLSRKIISRFIAISKAVRSELISSHVDISLITVIYNGIDTNKYAFYPRRKVSFSTDDEIRIGCVARLDIRKKGQDLLVYAIEHLVKQYPNIRCTFAGDIFPPEQNNYNTLLQYVRDHDLEEHIRFAGNVPDIATFLRGLDIFVLPSRFEGFGISLIEALAAGVPSVACNLDGPAEIISSRDMGVLVTPGDSRALADGIAQMIETYHNFNTKTISEQIMNCYSMDRVVKEHYPLYIT